MADAKLEKALYGPSTAEVALGAILGLFVGVLAACIYLVFKPVAQVKEMPKEPVRGVVYYIPGSDSSAKSKNWQAKLKQFNAGASIEVIEDEMNAWANATFAAAPKPAAAKPDAAAPAPNAPASGGIFQPGTPNFKIKDGKLQIGFKCLLNWYGLAREVTVVTTGDIRRSGDHFVYHADTLHLGSCPLHLLPAVSGLLISHLIEKKAVPDEFKSAWAKLGDATLEGATLKLSAQ